MLEKVDELKFAVEDARARQTALLQLMYAGDQLAMSLLRLYVTIGVGAVSAAAAGLKGLAAIPAVPAVGLLGAAISFFVGSVFCFRALETAEVGLPGRGPEFWQWALETPNVDLRHAVSEYLRDLGNATEKNRLLNKQASAALRHGKQAGIAAPLLALAVSAGAWLGGL